MNTIVDLATPPDTSAASADAHAHAHGEDGR